jgi:hypothetical protein
MKISTKSTSGTSFYKVTFNATPSELISILGNAGSADKSNFDWTLETTDIYGKEIVFTIYDWKEGFIEMDQIIEWHIGAFSFMDSMVGKAKILEALQPKKNEKTYKKTCNG